MVYMCILCCVQAFWIWNQIYLRAQLVNIQIMNCESEVLVKQNKNNNPVLYKEVQEE
jgi:hypothetical protein